MSFAVPVGGIVADVYPTASIDLFPFLSTCRREAGCKKRCGHHRRCKVSRISHPVELVGCSLLTEDVNDVFWLGKIVELSEDGSLVAWYGANTSDVSEGKSQVSDVECNNEPMSVEDAILDARRFSLLDKKLKRKWKDIESSLFCLA